MESYKNTCTTCGTQTPTSELGTTGEIAGIKNLACCPKCGGVSFQCVGIINNTPYISQGVINKEREEDNG